MKTRRRLLSLVLIGSILFVLVSGNALAAESIEQDQPFVLSTYSKGDMVYIVRTEKTTSYNDVTGEVFDENGCLVGRLLKSGESTSICSNTEEEEGPPRTIQHGLTILPKWIYSTSTWSDAVIYEKSEAAGETVVSSLVIAAGLALVGVTGGWNVFWSVFWAAIYAAWNEKGPQADSYYVHVRKYIYCNRYVLSDFGYVWQAYLEDYTPQAVLSCTYSLTH